MCVDFLHMGHVAIRKEKEEREEEEEEEEGEGLPESRNEKMGCYTFH